MIRTKGAVDQSVIMRIIDATDGTPETGVTATTTGIDLWYAREGAVHTSLTTWTGVSGTGTAAADSTTLTGSSTSFVADFTAGDELLLGAGASAERRIIDTVTSDTQLSVTVAFATSQTSVAVSELDANDLATEDAAHADYHLIHISDGYYRVDLPDAALAAGVDYTAYGGAVTGMIVVGGVVDLLDADLYDGVRGGLTALPNAVAGTSSGLPIQSDLAAEADIADAVWDEASAGHTTAGTSGAQLWTDIDAVLADTDELQGDLADGGRLDLLIDAIKAKTDNLPQGITKNAALSNFTFMMVDATDHFTPETGLTVTGERSLDAGAFVAVTGAITEISDGLYQFDAATADTNGDIVTWRFSSAGAADTVISFKTET